MLLVATSMAERMRFSTIAEKELISYVLTVCRLNNVSPECHTSGILLSRNECKIACKNLHDSPDSIEAP